MKVKRMLRKFFGMILVFALTFALTGFVPGTAMKVRAANDSYTYSYMGDCQRSPVYPKKTNTFAGSGIQTATNQTNLQGTFTVTYKGLYKDVKDTLGVSITSNYYSSYGIPNLDYLPIYELQYESTTEYGSLVAISADGKNALFLNYRAFGFLLSTETLTAYGSKQFTVGEDLSDIFASKFTSLTNISLDKTQADATKDDVVKVTASVTPANASDKRVVWSNEGTSGLITFYADEACTVEVSKNTPTDKLTVYAKLNDYPAEDGSDSIYVKSAETPTTSDREARCNLSLKKVQATITKAPTAKANLTADGTEKELVEAGTASGGTLEYAVGTDKKTAPTTGWSTSIPKKADAGTYYVWYRVVADSYHTDLDPVCIEATIAQNPDSGEIITEVATDEKAPESTVDGMTKELAKSIATEEELKQINSGAETVMSLEMKNIDDTVSAEEKKVIETSLKAEDSNANVAMFLDLSMFFKVGNAQRRQITTLNGKKVSIKVKVPSKFYAPTGVRRTFYVLQLHNGVSKILTKTTNTEIPFDAGDFSTYAIAYSDENLVSASYNTSIKIKQSDSSIKISWDKVKGVAKVKVYMAYCGSDYPKKPVDTTKDNSVTIKKLNGKKLNFKKNFKLYLVAYDKKGNEIGKTPSAHFIGKKNTKYSNPKSITLSKTKVSIAVGKKEKIKATIKLENSKCKPIPTKHAAKFRYRSTNKYIASVDKNGNIKGVAPGKCDVYVYSQNGLSKKVKVTVKK